MNRPSRRSHLLSTSSLARFAAVALLAAFVSAKPAHAIDYAVDANEAASVDIEGEDLTVQGGVTVTTTGPISNLFDSGIVQDYAGTIDNAGTINTTDVNGRVFRLL